MSKVFKYVKEVFRGWASVDLCGHKFKSREPMRVVFKFDNELLKRVVKPAVSKFRANGETVIEARFSLSYELETVVRRHKTIANDLELLCSKIQIEGGLCQESTETFHRLIGVLRGNSSHIDAWFPLSWRGDTPDSSAPLAVPSTLFKY